MKLVFLFPLINTVHDDITWVPLSTTTLIGNLKKVFPKIVFCQYDLAKEIGRAISRKLLNKDYLILLDEIVKMKQIPMNSDFKKFNFFFDEIIKYLKLEKFDHYFFTIYNRNENGVIANILLAKYLKKKYKNKEIVFGGLYGFGENIARGRRKLPKICNTLGFSFVPASYLDCPGGERATIKLINDLVARKKIRKVYPEFTPPAETLKGLPDFKSFKSLKYFRYSAHDLQKMYDIKLNKEVCNEKIIFLPYSFSLGCFWRKCAYCTHSSDVTRYFYHKAVDEIVDDLINLKNFYKTKYFIFFNNNFNFNLEFSKELLRKFIRNKLDILWADSFNLVFLDDELIDLLPQAGCFKVDLGLTTANPNLQKLYNNMLQDNKYLKNIKKISEAGIWTQINIIANLPYAYTVKEEMSILKKYIEHIDAVTLNMYRNYISNLQTHFDQYNLEAIREKFYFEKTPHHMYFIEKKFKGTIEDRKNLMINNFENLRSFFKNNGVVFQNTNMYLLGLLYNNLGFKNKNKIKEIITSAKCNYPII